LADFGLATFSDPTSKGLKGTVGTDYYMAPEIVTQYENTGIP
jgi:serine/threonine protein kinase